MKNCKLFLCIIFMCGVYYAHAQQPASHGGKRNLALSVWVSDNINGMPAEAQNNLQNKLAQIASKQGIAANPGYSRFILTANVVVQEKYITSTAPPKQAYKLDITFYVGDGFEGKVFSSHTSSVTGIGDNDTKAYINALKNIKVTDPAYKKLMDLGASKIVDYFNTQCDFVIREAQTLAASQKYEEALWKLTSVPDVCADCWKRAMDEADAVYQKKIDRECQIVLNEANNIWNTGQHLEAAAEAGAVLVKIDPNSNCFDQALALSRKMAQHIQERDAREEAAKKEELQFQRTMEERKLQMEEKREAKRAEQEDARIQAYREVGVAWAESRALAEAPLYTLFW